MLRSLTLQSLAAQGAWTGTGGGTIGSHPRCKNASRDEGSWRMEIELAVVCESKHRTVIAYAFSLTSNYNAFLYFRRGVDLFSFDF